jgi:chromosomal replication initiation ATPase DnaA
LEKYPWSSHPGYLSDAKKWDWLHKGFVLSMFSDDKRLSRKRYKEFVSNESAEEINRILGRKKLPSMLGRSEFTEWVKRTFFSEKRHMEVPESKSLAPDVGRIRAVMCKSYDVDEQSLTLTRRGVANEARSMAIYLTRLLRGDTLEEIGREFKIAKYSSVSSIIERMKAMIEKDRRLRKRAVELRKEINMSQEQT